MSVVRGESWPLLACVVAATVLAAPLWLVAMPAMPDYPAHLASFWLIGGGASSHYTVNWAFVPNLAAEAIVPLLAKVMPLAAATKLFLTLAIALWVMGPALIQRALFGRGGFSAVIAAVFAYNANFLWGFFNYTFAMGLGFCVLAAWIATDGQRTLLQQAAFSLAFTLVYFAHLFAFAAMILAITCFEFGAFRNLAARVASMSLLCLPAAAAFLLLKPHGAGSSELSFDLIDTARDRIDAAILYGFDKPATVLTAGLAVAVIAALLVRRAKIHPRMRIVLVVFTLATLLAPEWAFGGWGVQLRLPAVLGALAFAGLDWNVSRRVEMAAAGAALLVMATGATALAADWQRFDEQYAAFRNHIDDLHTGARVLVVLDGDSLGWAADQPYWHMAELAVMDRDVFTPLMFTTTGQHIIHPRPPSDRIAAATAAQGSPPDIDELDDLAAGRLEADEDYRDIYPYLVHFQCHFDQAIVVRGAGRRSRVPVLLKEIRDHGFYATYNIMRDPRCR